MNDVKWKEFNFEDIFIIKDGYYNKKPPTNEKGDIPFLGATQNNNGITGYCKISDVLNYDKVGEQSKRNINERIFEGNSIAITNNGSVGYAYYQNSKFTCSHDITVIYGKKYKLTYYISMFLIPLIQQTGKQFAYAKKWRPIRMRKSKLILPVTSTNTPDWEYMEKFSKDKIFYSKKRITTFLENEVRKVENFEDVYLKDAKWKTYIIENIIDINNGVRLTKANMEVGKRPFIGATEYNNGITNFVLNSNNSIDHNVLGINYNGSVCQGFYHPYEAIFSDDVKRLRFKNGINNEYTLKFLLTIIEKQRSKYQYGYKFNEKRMKKQKIVLPTTNEKEIDFKFMENYIKKLKYNAIINTLNSFKKS